MKAPAKHQDSSRHSDSTFSPPRTLIPLAIRESKQPCLRFDELPTLKFSQICSAAKHRVLYRRELPNVTTNCQCGMWKVLTILEVPARRIRNPGAYRTVRYSGPSFVTYEPYVTKDGTEYERPGVRGHCLLGLWQEQLFSISGSTCPCYLRAIYRCVSHVVAPG